MVKTYITLLTILLLPLGIFGQNAPASIHQIQHEKYREMEFNQEIPGFADRQQPGITNQLVPDKEVFGFHPHWMGTAWQNYNFHLLSTVAFFGVEVNANGSLGNAHGWPVTSLINTAHSYGVKVVLVAILFDSDDINTLLSSAANRQNLIDNLLASVTNAGADGVNIDFENMPSGQKAHLVTFMTDLTEAFHAEIPGASVTIDMPAVDWSDNFDYDGLADACDGLMIMGYAYHWSGSSTTGPVSPLYGSGSLSVSWTVDDYLSKTGNDADKLILGLPYYGFEWPTSGAAAGASTTGDGDAIFYSEASVLAETYGLLRDTESGQIPWYRYEDDGQWYQGWFDDSLSLSAKYNLALEENLQGIGIWALGYDGQAQELWGALADHFVTEGIPPSTPQGFFVKSESPTSVTLGVDTMSSANQYVIYTSENGRNFTSYAIVDQPQVTLSTLEPDSLVYLRMTAKNSAGESPATEVLGIVPGETSHRALVVNGFDRVSGTANTRDFIRQHGGALWGNGVYFDAVSNEAVKAGRVALDDYSMVDWILGEEGTSTHAFDPDEQDVVAEFLNGGGAMFVSGSEIGYDLAANGSSEDQYFYEQYLKAEYITDAAGYPLSYSGVLTSDFASVGTIYFDDGTHGTYYVDYPDGIHPVGGAEVIFKYEESDYEAQGGAGIAFTGSFNLGSPEGQLVYISPGFETVYPVNGQMRLMESILTYFDIPTGLDISDETVPEIYSLIAAYPNPFNATVTIRYHLQKTDAAPLIIGVYDITGRQIVSLHSSQTSQQEGEIRWNGKNQQGNAVATGTYFVIAEHAGNREILKITLLK